MATLFYIIYTLGFGHGGWSWGWFIFALILDSLGAGGTKIYKYTTDPYKEGKEVEE
jgi:hypothetical protein